VRVLAGVLPGDRASWRLAHGAAPDETGWTVRVVPLTVGGLISASLMVMLDSARRKTAVPALVR
jgi:hypothetical protein